MTSRATISSLHRETENLLANFDHSAPGEAVDLIDRCRLALTVAGDDGLGPWESPEMEYAMHIAARQHLPKLALVCACEVLAIAERSFAAMGDHGFMSLLA
jgi:hypothetical protein